MTVNAALGRTITLEMYAFFTFLAYLLEIHLA